MSSYSWARRGDVNAFFGLMLDNVAVMVILVSVLTAEGKFTTNFVLTHMIPGTALGVLLGDLVYTFLAFRLARRLGRHDVTAMPLGLDTPSTFGVAFLVLLPMVEVGQKMPDGTPENAMKFAWHVGLLVLIFVGVFKVVLAPLGNMVRRLTPRAGLLGSLAAIALVLIAFLPMLMDGIAGVPLVGMVALVVILLTLVAHRQLPGQFPGALAAVLLGIVIYQVCLGIGKATGTELVPPMPPRTAYAWDPMAMFSFTNHSREWWDKVFWAALGKLPVIFPFALATVVGGIDCTESAAAVGDEYDTRSILLTEGIASLVAGMLGGVIQTTPYIGHPAYKKMGGRAAYTLATALFIGVAGYFGWFTLIFDWLPRGALFPILVFVGLEITAQSFHATPTRHYPALALAMLPALAYVVKLFFETAAPNYLPPSNRPDLFEYVQTLRCLANGFLITGMLWASALAMILDGRLRWAAGCFALAALCSLVGVIHSPLAAEQIGLPHHILAQVPEAFHKAVSHQTPYHWAGAYGLIVGMLLLLDLVGPRGKEPDAAPAEEEKTKPSLPRPGGEGITVDRGRTS
jgi:adenine/guanine/hypoxanthine permease